VYGGFGIWRCSTEAEPALCATQTLVSLLLSRDAGHTWTRLQGTPLDGQSVTAVIVHPQDAATAWAATAGGGVYLTHDAGQTWEPASAGLRSMMVMALAGDAENPELLLAGTAAAGVFRSEDSGQTWRESSAGMDPNEPIGAIVVDPVRPNVVYSASWRSGVFLSEDAA
jgi:photosystem II stability/assembly factor-like uncharacterized protein